MRLKFRRAGLFLVGVSGLAACNLVLGLSDLTDRPPADASTDLVSVQDSSTPDTSRPDAVAPAEAGDAGLPICGDGSADPCRVTVDQTGGTVYPTWPITSDLPISAINAAIVPPLLPTYSNVTQGETTELNSGLTWKTVRSQNGDNVRWDIAEQACRAAGPGFRLPTRVEAATTQYRPFVPAADGGPTRCVPPPFAFNGVAELIWTSTQVPFTGAGDSTLRYIHYETICGFLTSSASTSVNAGIRCVKGDSRPANFVVSTRADTVYAVETGLDWERTGVVVRRYSEAKAHCDGRGARLPIIQEVYGIIDTRTTKLFDGRLFSAPTGAARAILSQTVSSYDGPTSTPYYHAVALLDGPWGAEDQAPPDDLAVDLLVRCVNTHKD